MSAADVAFIARAEFAFIRALSGQSGSGLSPHVGAGGGMIAVAAGGGGDASDCAASGADASRVASA